MHVLMLAHSCGKTLNWPHKRVIACIAGVCYIGYWHNVLSTKEEHEDGQCCREASLTGVLADDERLVN